MITILIAEDDQQLRRLFSTLLIRNGYRVLEAENGENALKIMETEHISLLITDVMMPVMSGYELVRMIRQLDPNLPILMITAKDSIDDKQKGFGSGIDDYMVKPVNVNEMLMRVDALLRRAKIINDRRLEIGTTILKYDELAVIESGKESTLPQKEFYLLYKMLSYPNLIFTRQQLMDEIWGIDVETETRTVDVHINRLRDRFKVNEDFEIVTIRGLGYKVVKK